MALQPIPLTWYRSSSCMHFQFSQTQTQTNTTFNFSVSCSNQPTQVEIKKKKNSSKASFSDQIRDKWSLKLPSQTHKFPWQEQQQQEPQPQLEEELPQFKENESSTTNSSLNFEFPKRLSPWPVPENPKHPQFDSEPNAASVDIEENEKPLQKNSGGSVVERQVQESESGGLKKRKSNTELAERLIPEHELKRLRNVALRMVDRFSVGVAGITQELVDSVHRKWTVDEVVKFKFDSPLSANMTRAHQILEVHFFTSLSNVWNDLFEYI